MVEHDDGIRPDISTAALSKLKPVFKKDGSTTAGNSSQVLSMGLQTSLHNKLCSKVFNTRHVPWTHRFGPYVNRASKAGSGRTRRQHTLILCLQYIPCSATFCLSAACSVRYALVETNECVQVTDGAAAVLMMTRGEAMKRQLPILGIFRSFAAVGVDPAIMGVGPAVAIPEAVKQAGLAIDDIDLFELNEAFASQVTVLAPEVMAC